jgi:hypothetical protein
MGEYELEDLLRYACLDEPVPADVAMAINELLFGMGHKPAFVADSGDEQTSED